MDSEQKYSEVDWMMIADESFVDKMRELPLIARRLISEVIEDGIHGIGTDPYMQKRGLIINDRPDSDSFFDIEFLHMDEGDIIFSDINEISCDDYLDYLSAGLTI